MILFVLVFWFLVVKEEETEKEKEKTVKKHQRKLGLSLMYEKHKEEEQEQEIRTRKKRASRIPIVFVRFGRSGKMTKALPKSGAWPKTKTGNQPGDMIEATSIISLLFFCPFPCAPD